MSITGTELAGWLNLPSWASLSTEEQEALDLVASAAVAQLDRRFDLPNTWSDDVKVAALMVAAKLYRRKASPEGVATFEGYGVAIRRFDPDVEIALSPYLRIEFA